MSSKEANEEFAKNSNETQSGKSRERYMESKPLIEQADKDRRRKLGTGTPLYDVLKNLMSLGAFAVLNMKKDIKAAYGYRVLNRIGLAFDYFERLYQAKPGIEKYKCIEILEEHINVIDISIIVWNDCNFIGKKCYFSFAEYLGNIKIQIDAWKKAILKQMSAEDRASLGLTDLAVNED